MLSAAVTLVLLSASSVAFAQGRLAEVHVSGTSRPTAAVLSAAGLKIGQAVAPKDLDSACRSLMDSGFFRAASYKYQSRASATGVSYSLSFDLTDESSLVPVVLDIPNADQEQLWTQFKAADPLLDKQMPDTDGAERYYRHALEQLLAKSGSPQPLIAKREADLTRHQMIVVFRPAKLPKLRQITFEGNHAIDSATLENTIHKVAIGEDYSDREFRLVVESNLTAKYEELGYLQVRFPKITAVPQGPDSIAASVTVEEGRSWKLGDVQLAGDNLPADQMVRAGKFRKGEVANWKEIQISIARSFQVLRADGYLSPHGNPNRIFHDETGMVDLRVDVQRGARFYFGTLEIQGLNAKEIETAQDMWELRPGAPLDGPYLDDYVGKVFSLAHSSKRNVNREMNVRQPGNLVDVVLKF
jgi:outer membrane protein assembly factor BamA